MKKLKVFLFFSFLLFSCNIEKIKKIEPNSSVEYIVRIGNENNINVVEGDLETIYYKNKKLIPKEIFLNSLLEKDINTIKINERFLLNSKLYYNDKVFDSNLSYKISDSSVIKIESSLSDIFIKGLKEGTSTLEIYSNLNTKLKKIVNFKVLEEKVTNKELPSGYKIFLTHQYSLEPNLSHEYVGYYSDMFFEDLPEEISDLGLNVNCSIKNNIVYSKREIQYLYYYNKDIIIPNIDSNNIDWSPDGDKLVLKEEKTNNLHIIDVKNKKVKIITFYLRDEINHLKWFDNNNFFFQDQKNKIKLLNIDTLEEKTIVKSEKRLGLAGYSIKTNKIFFKESIEKINEGLIDIVSSNISTLNLDSYKIEQILDSSTDLYIEAFNRNNSYFYYWLRDYSIKDYSMKEFGDEIKDQIN